MAREPLFDLASHARRGPDRRDRLSTAQLAHIARTVRRTPEVMVKVLSRGGQDLKAVGRHFDYLRLRKEGELDIEGDDGGQLRGDGTTKRLLNDWDLDLEEHRHRSNLDARGGGSAKLVHKVLFSMPAGTEPKKVLKAVKNFAREEFALKHRYAMVLHTDEPHPHVHLVLKAVSEQGERLHIRKATLREWRHAFALHLRELGLDANATERVIRGATTTRKLDGIYRCANDPTGRRYSTHMKEKEEALVREMRSTGVPIEPGKSRLIATRNEVDVAWRVVSSILEREGQPALAAEVRRFSAQMPPVLTDKEQLLAAVRARQQPTQHPPPRAR